MPSLDVHSRDDIVFERVGVVDDLIGDEGSSEIANNLMNFDDGAPGVVMRKTDGVDSRIDCLKLARPICANVFTPQNAADFLTLPNVICLGGSWIAPPALVRAGDWKPITQLARSCQLLRPKPL